MQHDANKAVVVLSGGQDSTTCLYWAIEQGYDVHTVTFDYRQKHRREIESAMLIASMAGIANEKVELVQLGANILEGTSPLVNRNERLEQYKDHRSLPGGLEKTFVPMRNQLFLTVAANRAYCLGASILITGVCEEDYGGYPDCRRIFIDSLEDTINFGTYGEVDDTGTTMGEFQILTPLMSLTKAKTVQLAMELPGCYRALAFSHTAYDGQYPPTGKDHASLLRAKGFEEAGVPDPLVLRAVNEKMMEWPDTPNYMASPLMDLCQDALEGRRETIPIW
jgi:7-cyano-7-deazaguanine synthase